MPGVVRTRVGYAGGTKKDPTYRSLGDHTESFQVDFDPAKVTYERLLEVFWQGHDPAHAAYSRQYKAVVFFHDDEQERLAEESRDRVAKALGAKVATEILPAGPFTAAEDYHQKYRLRGARDLMAEFRAMYPDEVHFRESTAAARVNGYLDGEGTPEQLKDELPRLGLSEEGGKVLTAIVAANRGATPACGD